MMRTRTIVTSCAIIAILSAASPAHAAAPLATIAPAMASVAGVSTEWDWPTCKKFWKRQLGKTAGVTGVVTLVAAAGVLIVMSARKKT